MRHADHLTIESGVSGFDLMLSAGQAVANMAHEKWPDLTVIILCGGGNNGGDGLVAGKFLHDMGADVRVFTLKSSLLQKGDAKKASGFWDGKTEKLKNLIKANDLSDNVLIIDALFGIGFCGRLNSDVSVALDFVKHKGWPVLAIDVPSGIDGDALTIDPHTLRVVATVTFFRKKICHVLMPTMAQCGEISVHDIGISGDVIGDFDIELYENTPFVWKDRIPQKTSRDHKYNHGHCVILGGAKMTGAARMAANAAMRIGAGACSIVAPDKESAHIYQEAEPHLMVESLSLEKAGTFEKHIQDERRNAVLIGPGAGLEDITNLKAAILKTLESDKAVILDADALSCFEDEPQTLLQAMTAKTIITPHEGEFKRLFPALEGARLDRVRQAITMTKAVIVLKGADTLIAQNNQPVFVNTHASPHLATAGAGDVLAGMICGLSARRMSAFDGARAACWIHGEASLQCGAGLVAPDLIDEIPAILRNFSLI
jgi:NAD(P)H-hydrate epimerase